MVSQLLAQYQLEAFASISGEQTNHIYSRPQLECQELQHNGHGAAIKLMKLYMVWYKREELQANTSLGSTLIMQHHTRERLRFDLWHLIFTWPNKNTALCVPERERERERMQHCTWCFRLVSGCNSIHEHPFILGPRTRYSVIASWEASKPVWWAKMTLSVFPSFRSTCKG